MDFVLIKTNSPKWEEIWEWVAGHNINQGLEIPSEALNEGFAWEYRGTYVNGKEAVSEFLHRHHPHTKTLHKLSYGHEITDEDIEKKYRI